MKILSLIFAMLLFPAAIIFSSSHNSSQKAAVLSGADILLAEKLDMIKGKKIGIVTNHSALLSSGGHLVDSLFRRKDLQVTALFGPEHGIRGDAPDGITINSNKDESTGIPVFSLYGKTNKPTKEMLRDVEVLLFDIQDVGARFYTFISTLYYTLQAGAENKIPVIVLDRPNPIGGVRSEGPIRKDDQVSFVGIAPIPVQHGFTIGELAKYYNESGLLGKNLKADLKIVKMKNWKRELFFDETGLKWVKPSPNIPDLQTAIVYPGTCLIEGTNVSEGRGTMSPFLTIGAPFINSMELIKDLQGQSLTGIKMEAADFTPVEIARMASKPKHENILCHGIKITVTDRRNFSPVDFGIKLICTLQKLYPSELKFRESAFDRLSGDKSIREKILSGTDAAKIIAQWQKSLNLFNKTRKQFLLY